MSRKKTEKLKKEDKQPKFGFFYDPRSTGNEI